MVLILVMPVGERTDVVNEKDVHRSKTETLQAVLIRAHDALITVVINRLEGHR